jgi:protein gp37
VEAPVTSIEWTDTTWNPITGCDRTSPGCDHCYALTLARRLKAMGNPRYQVDGDDRTSGPGFAVTLHRDKLNEPRSWRAPRRVFVNSMSDLFHREVPAGFIADVFDTMLACPQHTFQVLTKRPQRMRKLTEEWSTTLRIDPRNADGAWEVPPWVWLGTSIETNDYRFRADHLRATPAAVRFLSLEPLLGPLPGLDLTGIDWVIIGGESGPGARPMELAWVEQIMEAAVRCPTRPAVFVKQLGSVLARQLGASGKGGDPVLWPGWLQVRDWPRVQVSA